VGIEGFCVVVKGSQWVQLRQDGHGMGLDGTDCQHSRTGYRSEGAHTWHREIAGGGDVSARERSREDSQSWECECYNHSSFLRLPFNIPYMPVFFFYDVFNLL